MSHSESPEVEGGLHARGLLRAKSRHPFVSASISKADISLGVLGEGDEWIRVVRFGAGTSPSLGLNLGMARVAERSTVGGNGVGAFDAGGEGGGEEAVEVTVEDCAGV